VIPIIFGAFASVVEDFAIVYGRVVEWITTRGTFV